MAAADSSAVFCLHAYTGTSKPARSGAWLFDQLQNEHSKTHGDSNGHHGKPIRFHPRRLCGVDHWVLGRHSDLALATLPILRRTVEAFFEVERKPTREKKERSPRQQDFPLCLETGSGRATTSIRETPVRCSGQDGPARMTYIVRQRDAPDAEIDAVEYRTAFEGTDGNLRPHRSHLWAVAIRLGVPTCLLFRISPPDGHVRALAARNAGRAFCLRAIDETNITPLFDIDAQTGSRPTVALRLDQSRTTEEPGKAVAIRKGGAAR